MSLILKFDLCGGFGLHGAAVLKQRGMGGRFHLRKDTFFAGSLTGDGEYILVSDRNLNYVKGEYLLCVLTCFIPPISW